MDEIKTSMTTQSEEERSNLEVLHAQELEELQEKTDTTFQEKKQFKSLQMVKDRDVISNSHLWECQLEYLSQVDRFLNYEN